MSDGSDPYLYPGTDVLKNLRGIRNEEQLGAFETLNTAARAYELVREPTEGNVDKAHLKAIHRYLFQDIFAWAGTFRTTMLRKSEHLGLLPTWLTPPHFLDHEAERIFAGLHRARLLRGHTRTEFARLAAKLLADIKLHPFREGNGRTQRIFVAEAGRRAGHTLHFDVVSRERMVQAGIEATGGKPKMMSRLFDEITDAQRINPLRRAIAFLSREKFNWNDTYISTTTSGQQYAGTLVGRDGDAFMMRSDNRRILIGHTVDIDPTVKSGDRIALRATN